MVAVVDYKMTKEAKESLINYGYKVITLPPHSKLGCGVSSHPDMLIFATDTTLITSESYYDENTALINEIISNTGFSLAVTSAEIGEKYPNDVTFNVACVGKYLIANTDYTEKEILRLANERGMTLININQGYAKCSIAVVGDNAVITSDNGIYKTLTEKTDLDILKIREGFIDLPPFDYGFIGGATGSDSQNVYFCGDLNSHPDGDSIKAFCQKHSKNAVSLSSGKLADVGTIFLF